jgi:hypothetical protein
MKDTTGGLLRPHREYGPSQRLARLFGICTGDFLGWGDEELRESLLGQLDCSLLQWLKPNSSLVEALAENASGRGGHRMISLGDLLSHPCPPILYLRRAKEVAKAADVRLKAPLPPPVASALYVSVIATAMVKCGQRITEMSDEQLRQGLGWVVEQEWIDESLRQSASSALELMRTG